MKLNEIEAINFAVNQIRLWNKPKYYDVLYFLYVSSDARALSNNNSINVYVNSQEKPFQIKSFILYSL